MKILLHYNMISVSEFPFRNRRNTVEWPWEKVDVGHTLHLKG